MTKRKLSEEQILAVVKQLEAGRTAAEMAREVGVSTFTIIPGSQSTAAWSRVKQRGRTTWRTRTVD